MSFRVELVPAGVPEGDVFVPGSKSITNRALVCAALAEGVTLLRNASLSDDSRLLVEALRTLGFECTVRNATADLLVYGRGGEVPARTGRFDLGNAGTSVRFLTSLLCLGRGHYVVDGSRRMRERPIGGLVEALQGLGAEIRYLAVDGYLPLKIAGKGLLGGRTRVATDVSSQFVSSVLMAAPRALEPVEIEIATKAVSRPYIDMTVQVMARFGAAVQRAGETILKVAPAAYRACDLAVEADAAAAGYFFALAAIAGGRLRVVGIGADCAQPELRLLSDLERMGCVVERTDDSCLVRGPRGPLKCVDTDMNDHPDSVPTLAVAALFAQGVTRIRNVRHLRHKETDRLAALAKELGKLGARVAERGDGLEIEPPAVIRPAVVETYGDHRMAMAFALAGARVAGLVIDDADVVGKSFPAFWEALPRAGVGVRKIG